MNKILLYIFIGILLAPNNGQAQDYLYGLKKKDRDRATYWEKKGYSFDYKCMDAAMMDQKVKNHQRADYWKLRGIAEKRNGKGVERIVQGGADFLSPGPGFW